MGNLSDFYRERLEILAESDRKFMEEIHSMINELHGILEEMEEIPLDDF